MGTSLGRANQKSSRGKSQNERLLPRVLQMQCCQNPACLTSQGLRPWYPAWEQRRVLTFNYQITQLPNSWREQDRLRQNEYKLSFITRITTLIGRIGARSSRSACSSDGNKDVPSIEERHSPVKAGNGGGVGSAQIISRSPGYVIRIGDGERRVNAAAVRALIGTREAYG